MATDFLLMIDGIKGESQQDKHKDEIEIESFSWGATQQRRTAPAAVAGRARYPSRTCTLPPAWASKAPCW